MKTFRIKLLLILLSAVLLNCGGKEEKKKEGFTYDKTSNSEATVTTADASEANIVITSNDMMQFNVKEVKVKAGQKVKLTLRHIGKLDVNVMGHNIVILKQGVDLTDFATKAATAKDNKYIPLNSEDVVAHTDVIGGGQTASIEFNAPETGTYQFLCSFPGHFGMMQGVFIVE